MKDYSMQGMKVIDFIYTKEGKYSDYNFGYIKTGKVLQLEDFKDTSDIIFDSFAAGQMELEEAVKECKLYDEDYRKYNNEYRRIEPTDATMELYEIAISEIDYVDWNDDEHETDIIWVR